MMKNQKPKSRITLLVTALLFVCLAFGLSGCGSLARMAVVWHDKGLFSPAPIFKSQRLEDAQKLDPDDVKTIIITRVTEDGVQKLILSDDDVARRYMPLIKNLKLTKPSETTTEDDSLTVKIKTNYYYKEIELGFVGENYIDGKNRIVCEGLDALKKQIDSDLKN